MNQPANDLSFATKKQPKPQRTKPAQKRKSPFFHLMKKGDQTNVNAGLVTRERNADQCDAFEPAPIGF